MNQAKKQEFEALIAYEIEKLKRYLRTSSRYRSQLHPTMQ